MADFDWKEFLALAKAIAGRADLSYSAEASDRTAVSRAYYAAFCLTRNCAKSKLGFRPARHSEDHANLRKYLVRLGMSKMASDLNRLRQWRNQCDYDDRVPNLSNVVKIALISAGNVVQGCK